MPLVTTPGSDHCPVKAYKNMSELMPASDCTPAFLISTGKGKTKPLDHGYLQEKIKGLISKTGRDSSLYSILASCVFADLSKGWCILPQLKHILSILLVHSFWHSYLTKHIYEYHLCTIATKCLKTSFKRRSLTRVIVDYVISFRQLYCESKIRHL